MVPTFELPLDHEPIRVVVDACVLIDGALDPRSNAARLPELPAARFQFVICAWALSEAASVIEAQGRERQREAHVAMVLVDAFARRLPGLVVDDGGTYLPRKKDAHGKASIAATGAHAMLTRNVDDFVGFPCVTPAELLRRADFVGTTIEMPWVDPQFDGTVAVGCRTHPGESFGWMLAGESGERVGLSSTGRGRAEGIGDSPTDGKPVPHEHALTIFARVRHGTEILIDFADHNVDASQLNRAATFKLPSAVRFLPFLKYRPDNQWNMECWWIGAIARFVRDKHLRPMARHQTTEVTVSGTDVKTVIDNMVILSHTIELGFEIVEVALPGAQSAVYFRPEFRKG